MRADGGARVLCTVPVLSTLWIATGYGTREAPALVPVCVLSVCVCVCDKLLSLNFPTPLFSFLFGKVKSGFNTTTQISRSYPAH